MENMVSIYLFIVGLAFGSFALAMVDRMHAKKNWVSDRSKCEFCGHVLAPKDLVPVVSWLSTAGKCRYCNKKLSKSYPITEIITGLAFVLSYIYWPVELEGFYSIAQFVVWLVAIVLMTALFVFDIRWFLLPNKLVYPLIGAGFIWFLLEIGRVGISSGYIVSVLLAILVSAGIFGLLLVVSSGKWIGDGDVRLGVAIGLFVGSAWNAWLVLFLASTIGIIVSLPLIFKTKGNKKLKLKIPFGPLLIVALFVVVLFGNQTIEWYGTEILYL